MSRAEELAKRSRRISEILMSNGTVNTLRVIKYCIESETELRRLAKVEAEHEALKKAISDAVPVAQIRMSDGGLSVVNRVTTKGVQVSVHRADGDWTPLYTLNGIKKP